MPQLTLIAAMDRRNAIGRGNDLPWRLPADLQRFKALTLGKPLLMGRRTAESLGRALPGRENLVLTRSGKTPFEGMRPVRSIEDALDLVAGAPELMVIGGGEVYERCLEMAQRMHLTHVDDEVADADTWFPSFDPGQWVATKVDAHPADARHAHAFEFVDYLRRV